MSNPLNDKMEEILRAAYPEGTQFSSAHGVPALHAEIQSANRRLNQLQARGELTDDIIKEMKVATFRVTPKVPAKVEGEPAQELTETIPFEACPNCTRILDMLIGKPNILTGVSEKSIDER